jgi:hypothetical protein
MAARSIGALVLAGALGVALVLASAAPSALGPYPSLGNKCGVFPTVQYFAPGAPSAADETAWNQDISTAPVAANSDAIIAFTNSHGATELHPDFGSPRQYGIPYTVVNKKAKKTKVKFTAYGDEADHGKYRVPLNAPVEGGANADGDRHVISYDKARCKLYELYNAHPDKKHHRWAADVGVIWDVTSADLRPDGWTSADAAGLPIFPGLVRYDEAAAGQINHAIRVTFDTTRSAWIHPASHCASSEDSPNAPPMGLRLRLKAGYDTSQFSGTAAVIATALKRYGFIVADNGSNWYFSGSSDRRWDDDNLSQLKAIPGSAFEVVQSQADVHVC